MTWNDVENILYMYPNRILVVKKDQIESLQQGKDGYRIDFGIPKLEQKQWRKRVGVGCVHVHEYKEEYRVHFDKIDPGVSLWDHIVSDLSWLQIAVIVFLTLLFLVILLLF